MSRKIIFYNLERKILEEYNYLMFKIKTQIYFCKEKYTKRNYEL